MTDAKDKKETDADDAEMWSVEELVANMQDPSDDPGSRALFARALGERGEAAESAIPALINALSEPHSALQMEAADALAKMGPAALEAVPALKRMEETSQWPGVRKAAQDAILALTDPEEYRRVLRRRSMSCMVRLVAVIATLIIIASGFWFIARKYL